jgi:transposase
MCLLARRAHARTSPGCDAAAAEGHVIWPTNTEGVVSLTPAQLSMLTEGIDWRAPLRTWQPELTG